MKKKAIHITIDENLIKEIDEQREEQGHNRSSFINFIVKSFFKNQKKNRDSSK